jgi:hypothetical protein
MRAVYRCLSVKAPAEVVTRASIARIALALALAFGSAGVAPRTAFALDKQGSAHGGEVGEGDEKPFDIEGAAMVGIALVNPNYAARPDNTGHTLMRYALHADIDLIGRKLSIPLDVNLFTDRDRSGAAKFSPTELDVITGLTTTERLTKGLDGEVGARVEHDRPVDRGGFSQTYADIRARALYSLADVVPSLKRDLVDGDISGYLGFGWFVLNPTYAARPDNTGSALFRYSGHTELSVWKDRVSLGFDATFFTDRRTSAFRPSELDATYEIIGHEGRYEVHLAYERDMPIDRGGKVQSFVYALLVFNFDLIHDPEKPVEGRGTIISP